MAPIILFSSIQEDEEDLGYHPSLSSQDWEKEEKKKATGRDLV